MDRRAEILEKHFPTPNDPDCEAIYEAMDEYMRESVLEAFEYVVKNTTGHHIDEKGNVEFKFKGEWIDKEQLFQNFL
jgi:hypothetical protein